MSSVGLLLGGKQGRTLRGIGIGLGGGDALGEVLDGAGVALYSSY
jgi:hypothetical protein